ncbi:Smr/MutS family protein [Tranquillimonas rosea]|uniref:Smr/MutS family protein n=1 Tax=Tranquillimonas rosea TaxID=641238 RepID=UPI003BAA4364
MSGRRRPRGLRPEEHDLWRQVTDTTQPLPGRRHGPRSSVPSKPSTRTQGKTQPDPVAPFSLGEGATRTEARYDLAPSIEERTAADPVRMDRKAYGKMKRGKLSVEGRLDLHGLTLDQAHPRLNRFILDAQGQGKRLVLVITGKGRRGEDDGPIPRRPGVLRHQVPQWLRTPPLAQAVLQVSPAHRSHGGSGAYYVYLSRRR